MFKNNRISTNAGSSCQPFKIVFLNYLSAICRLLENKVYSDPEWTGYKAYSSARARYLDYPTVPYEDFQGEFLEAGFSKEAYLLINRWTFCEQNVFSKEKLAEITNISHRAYTKSYRLRYMLEELTASPIRYCILIPFVLLLFFALTGKNYRTITALLIFCMFGLVLGALAFLRLRVLIRVTVPLAMSACAFISLCFEGQAAESASGPDDTPRQQASESASGIGSGRIPRKLRPVFAGIFTVLLAIMFVLFFSGYKEAVASPGSDLRRGEPHLRPCICMGTYDRRDRADGYIFPCDPRGKLGQLFAPVLRYCE